MSIWLLGVALLGAVMAAPMPKYRIVVKADKHTDFRTLHSYAWTNGWAAFDRVLDRHIVAAIDAELASLGFVKRGEESCDVVVTYGALRRTDVDLHAHRSPDGTYPEYPVETDTAHLEQQIDTVVAQMFADYPTRH